MQEIKENILRRYKTETPHEIDIKSPKDIAKMLFKRKKRMSLGSDNVFNLPVVEVFETHS